MKKTLITLTALLVVGFITASAFAWGQGKGKQRDGKEPTMCNSLTQEQKTELKKLHQQFVDETYKTRSAMMTKHQQLRMLMETSSPDKAKAQALSDEVMGLKKAMADKRINFALKAKKIAPEINLMFFGPRGGGMSKDCCGPMGKGKNGPCTWNNYSQPSVQ